MSSLAPVLALALLTLAAILAAPYPPLQDFNEWVYQADLLARLPEGLPLPDVHLTPYPVPNTLFQVILGALAFAMPAAVAGKVFIGLYVAAAVAVAWGLARRYQPRMPGAFAALLLVGFFLNAPFWNGYGNYQTAVLLFAAWWLLPAAERDRPVLILAAGVLLFFAHALVFTAFAACVGVRALLARRILTTALALLPGVLLFGWYVLAKEPPLEDTGFAPPPSTSFLAFKAYTLAKIGPYHNFVFDSGGDAALRPALYWGGAAVNIGFTLLLLGTVGWGLWRAARQRRVALAPVAAALLLMLLFVVLPRRLDLVVVNPGERLMYPGLLLLLLVLPLPRWPVRVLGAGGLVLAASLLAFAGPNDWATSIGPGGPHDTQPFRPAPPSRVLFWHRPTAFACKWQEMERARQAGDAPRAPITFRTSILIGVGGEECDRVWEALQDRYRQEMEEAAVAGRLTPQQIRALENNTRYTARPWKRPPDMAQQ